jgi:aminobenzoyl-glutamate utilization protein B
LVTVSKEKKSALEFVDENISWLSDFHKEIWGYAEPAFREYKSVKAYVNLEPPRLLSPT